MKRLAFILVIFLFYVTLLVPDASAFGQSLDAPQVQIDAPVLRVAIVLDISGSMESYSLGGADLPAEIADIKAQIDEILNTPEYQDLSEQQKRLTNSEEVVNATRTLNQSEDAINDWYKNNGYGSTVEMVAKIEDILSSYGCNCWSQYLEYSKDIADLETKLEGACCYDTPPIGLEEELLTVIPLDNPEFVNLTEAYSVAEEAYNTVYDSSGLSDANNALYEYRENKGYYDLVDRVNEIAPSYGIPTKIELARQAGQILVELSRLDELSEGTPSELSLVTFSNYGELKTSFTSDFDLVESLINGLESQNMTNIGDGLNIALDQIELVDTSDQPSLIILLSDGYSNMGMVSQDMLSTTTERAKELNASICALGIGETEYDVDTDLLTGLASATQGSYLFAESGDEIVNFFISCRQTATGAQVTSFTGSIQQGEKKDVGVVTVDEDLEELSMTLSFLEGDLNMQLIDPDGEVVTPEYGGASDEVGENVHLIKIQDPKQGDWTVQVEAISVPSDRTSVIYNVVASKTQRKITPTPKASPTPTPSPSFFEKNKLYIAGGGICLAGLCLVVVIIVVIVLLVRNRRKEVAPPKQPDFTQKV